MLTQHSIKANSGARRSKRIRGRGDGSGRGSFSGKGCKGQHSRTGFRRNPGFEGGQIPLIMRMPKLRGFRNPNKVEYQVVNVEKLNCFADGDTIDFVALFEQRLISHKTRPIKILGNGELQKKLTVKADAFAKSAVGKIEGKGGTVVSIKPKEEAKSPTA